MKTKIITFILSFIFISGCSLDEKIYDTPMAETFIQSDADVTFLMNGVYSPLPMYNCYKTCGAILVFFCEDILAVTNSTYRDFNTRAVPYSHRYLTPIWNSLYTVIKNANSLINEVEESSVLTEPFKERIIGELHFMRAFSYFELVRLFGGVPIHIQPITGKSDFYPKRNTVDEVYAQIFSDLQIAIDKCLTYQKQPTAEKGRANKGAAQGLLALASLTYAGYLELNSRSSEASDYYKTTIENADAVINSNEYSLIKNYATLFDVDQEAGAYQEVIFGIQFTRDTKLASASGKGNELAYYLQPSNRYGVCGNVTDGKGNAYARIQPWFYDICTTGDYENDYRSEVNFVNRFKYQNTANNQVTYPLVPGTGDRSTPELYPYINKYKDANGLQARNNENDWFYLRLAEIYLIKAEAINELNGPTQEALDAFNKVRERARNADGVARETPADLKGSFTKEEFRLKIFDERGLEFVGEGKRWYDSVRMRYTDNVTTMQEYRYNDFYKNMSAGMKKAPAYNSETKTWGAGRVYPNCVVEWTDKFLIWPIPSTEIDSNPNMTQNSEFGW